MNAIFANESMEGFQGSRVEGLPHGDVMTLLREYKAI